MSGKGREACKPYINSKGHISGFALNVFPLLKSIRPTLQKQFPLMVDYATSLGSKEEIVKIFESDQATKELHQTIEERFGELIIVKPLNSIEEAPKTILFPSLTKDTSEKKRALTLLKEGRVKHILNVIHGFEIGDINTLKNACVLDQKRLGYPLIKTLLKDCSLQITDEEKQKFIAELGLTDFLPPSRTREKETAPTTCNQHYKPK